MQITIQLNKMNDKFKKAASLVEVLIILAVISTTVIASTTIAVNSQRTLIENERTQTANGVLIQALEIIKSPAQIAVVNPDFFPNTPSYYRLTQSEDRYVLASVDDRAFIDDCTVNSTFQVSSRLVQEPVNFPLCIMVEITSQPAPRDTAFDTDTFYEIRVQLLYQQRSELQQTILQGIRYEEFITI